MQYLILEWGLVYDCRKLECGHMTQLNLHLDIGISGFMRKVLTAHYDTYSGLIDDEIKQSYINITMTTLLIGHLRMKNDLVFANAFGIDDSSSSSINAYNFLVLLEKKKRIEEKVVRWLGDRYNYCLKILS